MEGFYPTNPSIEATAQTDIPDVNAIKVTPVLFHRSATQAVALSNNGVKTAVTDTGVLQTVSPTAQPPCARNLTVTYAGTAGDIKGGHQVTVRGKDLAGNAITETLPAATADTATGGSPLQGSKAFASVDPSGIDIPPHDGTGATTAIGWGDKLGLEYKLTRNTVQQAHLNNTPQGTAPTVAVSPTVLASNTMKLSSALNGTEVHAYLFVPA